MDNVTIGKLAQHAGVGVETLRYYERRGLIMPRKRTAAGYRLYDGGDALRRLRFIRRAQALGFSLDDIGELLDLSDDPAASAGAVRQLASAKIDDIDQRVRDLQRMKAALTSLAERCPGDRATTTACPILAALNGDGP